MSFMIIFAVVFIFNLGVFSVSCYSIAAALIKFFSLLPFYPCTLLFTLYFSRSRSFASSIALRAHTEQRRQQQQQRQLKCISLRCAPLRMFPIRAEWIFMEANRKIISETKGLRFYEHYEFYIR